jgi:hypothetical protein
MTYRPPYTDDPAGLDKAAPRASTPGRAALLRNPAKIAAFVVLLLVLSLVAVALFIAITIGVTILVGDVVPRPVNVFVAPIAGVAVAVLCFGGASRFRRGMFRNRYGLMRRPPRNPKPQEPAG